ncbi:MAG: hypothetical protein Q7U02_01570 [Desulfosalsimonadaceae bacterium]|nr:hypothetical protein [Desulfosalsimonadaceae bacterium]
MADSFGLAFFKSQEATKTSLPLEGTVLFTVADADKPGALETARLFQDLNFRILATNGTRQFLEDHGIAAEPVRKLGYGRPDIVDEIKNNNIHLVINTPSGRESKEDDSYIRKAAINYKVPYITTIASALAAAKGIRARRQGVSMPKSLQEYHGDIR